MRIIAAASFLIAMALFRTSHPGLRLFHHPLLDWAWKSIRHAAYC